jgi:OmpA-OmpF porin, OOP family
MRKLLFTVVMLVGIIADLLAQENALGIDNKAARKKHNQFELGIMGGAMVYTGDAHCEKFLLKNGLSPSGGAYLRYYLTDNFSVRANLLAGKIKGDDRNYPGLEHGDRNFKFTSSIIDFNGTLEWEPWGHKRYDNNGKFRRILSPYINIGAGFVNANPNVDYNEAGNPNLAAQIADDKANTTKMHFSTPFGIGWRYDLSERLTIGAEASYRVPFTDYLDGISKSGNPDARDWYETGTINVAYRFKYKRDVDGDGIVDEEDVCPTERGTLRGKGCPDQDGDGIVDRLDACPTEQGSPALNGCPDRDGDGIADQNDACPEIAGDAVNSGCPDRDGDGVIDLKDDCPNQKGLLVFNGCPDSDEDGIMDKNDACPTEKGLAIDNGCPAKDSDKDGIADRDDKCPNEAGSLSNNGCPEVKIETPTNTSNNTTTALTTSMTTTTSKPTEVSATTNIQVSSDAVVVGKYTDYSSAQNLPSGSVYSGNGVEVDARKLISSSVNVSNETITSEETEVFNEALYGIQFETGSAVITTGSYAILNRLYNIMQRRNSFSFEIGGHTDNTGNSVSNQRLSEARAKAVYNYLVKKGIASSRLSYVGYGDTNPVADNGSSAGRAKNRRVQFVIK